MIFREKATWFCNHTKYRSPTNNCCVGVDTNNNRIVVYFVPKTISNCPGGSFFLVAWQELPSLFKDTFEWASQKNSDWSFFVPFSGHFVTLLLLATETDGRILKSWSIHRFFALRTYQINEIFASECCALQKCFLWDTLDTFWTWKRRYFPGEFIQLHFVWKFPGVGQIFSDF